jgi:hypothetical protein
VARIRGASPWPIRVGCPPCPDAFVCLFRSLLFVSGSSGAVPPGRELKPDPTGCMMCCKDVVCIRLGAVPPGRELKPDPAGCMMHCMDVVQIQSGAVPPGRELKPDPTGCMMCGMGVLRVRLHAYVALCAAPRSLVHVSGVPAPLLLSDAPHLPLSPPSWCAAQDPYRAAAHRTLGAHPRLTLCHFLQG